MLGMEDGQMMIGDDFKVLCANRLRQRSNLFGIKVVGRGKPLQTQVEETLRAQHIGGVEAEIA